MAMGVLLALHEAGRRVPDEVSVVGFDDTPEAAFTIPPLTTVRQDFDELGRLSVRNLLATLAGEPTEDRLVAPTLVVRQSTSGPPAGTGSAKAATPRPRPRPATRRASR